MACELEFWPTYDPAAVEGSREERLVAYRAVRDFLRQRILERFPPHEPLGERKDLTQDGGAAMFSPIEGEKGDQSAAW